ncbi:fibrinogen-like protein 1 [Acropora millepora]|uniref:fibrinogen-like protein 1 n=1 Tax=Acropora millepora TaxID=45264 RepID=UPI001CF53A3E|nr:fibrinogen-like protein 1 [Acropora millepora]
MNLLRSNVFFLLILLTKIKILMSCSGSEAYFTTETDHAVVGHVISARDVDNAVECGWECLRDKRCISYNYQVKINQNDICEINDQTKSTKPTDYQPKPGVTYYELMCDIGTAGRACFRSPCLNGATCTNYCHDYVCVCTGLYEGRNCEIPKATSCKEVQSLGGTADGEYSIKLSESSIVSVYCDQTTDGGGWTVIQRRQSPYLVSFNRGWVEYQGGFGNVSSDFWLGNENIHLLSHPTPVKIRFELEASGGQQGFAEYENFTISGNSDNYRINLSGYSGNLGNSFFSSYIWWTENNMQFSTPDKDNDANPVGRCTDNSGWWYNYCGLINLNNPSHPHWNNWYQSSVIRSEMKIR